MNTTDSLKSINFLREVSLDELNHRAGLWRIWQLRAGQELWPQGSRGHEVGLLIEGSLAAELDNKPIGQIRPGELVGEGAALLHGSRRIVSVRAAKESTVATLPIETLRTLREEGSELYDALMAEATRCAARRLRVNGRNISRMAQGDVEVPHRSEVGRVTRLWRKLVPGGPKNACPPILPLLKRLPGLSDSEDARLEILANCFIEEPMEEGQIICLQAEDADCAWLVAAGKVDVVRHVKGNKATWLTTLGAGDFFGAAALVEADGTRTASCVAVSSGWLYRIDQRQYHQPPPSVRVLLNELMLSTLGSQLDRSNGVVREALELGASPVSQRLLLNSVGHVESFSSSGTKRTELAVTYDGPLERL